MSAGFTVACLGAGYFSQFHYDAWHRIDGAVPIASVDRDIARAQATGLDAYATLPALLDRHSPDIIDIITPPPSHSEAIQIALEARPKAIICQKPFCRDLNEATRAVDLARSAGTPLIVHENFRFQPWYRQIKADMCAGLLGEVLQLTFRLRPGDGQGPNAYLERQPYFQTMERFLVHETAVHWIDTFRFLMGDPLRVMADLRQLNPAISGEDAGHILFAYPEGKRALFDGNRLLDHDAENRRCTMGEAWIEGTEGTLTLSGDGAVRHRRFGEQESTLRLPASTFQGFGGDCVFHLQSHVVAALSGSASFENTGADYLAVMQQEEAIYKAATNGTWVDV